MSFDFEKFISDIEKREKQRRENQEKMKSPEISPQRKYNQLYRELWQNRVVWGHNKK